LGLAGLELPPEAAGGGSAPAMERFPAHPCSLAPVGLVELAAA